MGLCEGACASKWLALADSPRHERKCAHCRVVTEWNRVYKGFVHDECVIKEKNRILNEKHPDGPALNRRDRRARERAGMKSNSLGRLRKTQ